MVGQSGAGKSTLAKLTPGIYQPHSGRVLFDGLDLTGLDMQSVRQQFGIVTRCSYLLSATIRDNIALKEPSISMSGVIEIAMLACIHDNIIAMPMGYDTIQTDVGLLSGGQLQRMALARALIHQPVILLMDNG
jgi:ABC-type bacteriocin/lantibiotic exporter with double-glycine peptidase domain